MLCELWQREEAPQGDGAALVHQGHPLYNTGQNMNWSSHYVAALGNTLDFSITLHLMPWKVKNSCNYVYNYITVCNVNAKQYYFLWKDICLAEQEPRQQAYERQNSTEHQLPGSPAAGMDGKWSVTLQQAPWTGQEAHSCSSTQTNIWVLLIRMHKITDHLIQSVLDVCSLFQCYEWLVLQVVSIVDEISSYFFLSVTYIIKLSHVRVCSIKTKHK